MQKLAFSTDFGIGSEFLTQIHSPKHSDVYIHYLPLGLSGLNGSGLKSWFIHMWKMSFQLVVIITDLAPRNVIKYMTSNTDRYILPSFKISSSKNATYIRPKKFKSIRSKKISAASPLYDKHSRKSRYIKAII